MYRSENSRRGDADVRARRPLTSSPGGVRGVSHRGRRDDPRHGCRRRRRRRHRRLLTNDSERNALHFSRACAPRLYSLPRSLCLSLSFSLFLSLPPPRRRGAISRGRDPCLITAARATLASGNRSAALAYTSGPSRWAL